MKLPSPVQLSTHQVIIHFDIFSEIDEFYNCFSVLLDFEERLVTTVPLTSASTSVLFTKKGVPVTTATPSSSTLPVTAQSLNSLESLGKGTLLSNEDIIDLLKKPPKSVPMLRTKTSFQEFFKGIDRRRFESLLKEAYSDIDDLQEREKKVLRRLELMEGMM